MFPVPSHCCLTLLAGAAVAFASQPRPASSPGPAPAAATVSLRQANLDTLNRLGFKVAPGLPVERAHGRTRLRPAAEIATRLYALAGVFFWAGVPEKTVADHVLIDAMLRGRTTGQTGLPEIEILELPRAEAYRRHSATVGWRLENMWALAWVLGFDPPPSLGGQIDAETQRALVFEFMEFPRQTPDWLLRRSKPRSLAEVDRLEDLFYCAHNAVRSAQLGQASVPPGFDPVRDGGAIHERRQALTWVLSPGLEWDETDLGT